MRAHGAFCELTKPIFISKVLSILKIGEYGKVRIRFNCNRHIFVLKRSFCGAGLRQHLTLAPFFEVIGFSGPVTCTVSGTCFKSVFRN